MDRRQWTIRCSPLEQREKDEEPRGVFGMHRLSIGGIGRWFRPDLDDLTTPGVGDGQQPVDERIGCTSDHRREGQMGRESLPRRSRNRLLAEADGKRRQEQCTLDRAEIASRRQSRPPRDSEACDPLRNGDGRFAAAREDRIELGCPATGLEFRQIQFES